MLEWYYKTPCQLQRSLLNLDLERGHNTHMQADFGIITAKLLDAGGHFDFFLVDLGAGQLVQLFGNFLCSHFAVQLSGSAPLDLDGNDLALDLGSQFFSSSFGFGYLEQQDLADWLNWAEAELGTRKFILWGEGTGANTILFAAASGLLPASVSCAVAESPYASLHELAKHGIWTWYTVPAFPFLNSIEAKVNRSDAGYRMSDLELGAALRDADCTLPVLFLQSTTDEYILPEWTQEVYNAYSGPKELISEGLDHGTVYAYGQEKIEAAINEMS